MANNNLVKIAVHNGLKHYMLAPLPRGKGAKKRAELGLTVRLPMLRPCLLCSACTCAESTAIPVYGDDYVITKLMHGKEKKCPF